MTYTPPTLLELRNSISRDVRDINNATFSSAEIDDLINMAIAEVNRVAAKEYVDDVELIEDTRAYPLANVLSLFRVDLRRDGAYASNLIRAEFQPGTGWDFFNNTLYLPSGMDFDATTDILQVWGYAEREALTEETDVADLDLAAEALIRLYCQYTCFSRLVTSRALFQQWQTEVNNSDVSATQLLGMANIYSREWQTARNRARRLRRVA